MTEGLGIRPPLPPGRSTLKRVLLISIIAIGAGVLAVGTCAYRYLSRTPVLPTVTSVPLEVERYASSGPPESIKLPPHSRAATVFDEVMRRGQGKWRTVGLAYTVGQINVHGPEWSFTVAFSPWDYGQGYPHGTIILTAPPEGDTNGNLMQWTAPMSAGDYDRIKLAVEQELRAHSATKAMAPEGIPMR